MCPYVNNVIETVATGVREGADRVATQNAHEKSIPLQEFKPEWKHDGRRAGLPRNTAVIAYNAVLFAFWINNPGAPATQNWFGCRRRNISKKKDTARRRVIRLSDSRTSTVAMQPFSLYFRQLNRSSMTYFVCSFHFSLLQGLPRCTPTKNNKHL